MILGVFLAAIPTLAALSINIQGLQTTQTHLTKPKLNASSTHLSLGWVPKCPKSFLSHLSGNWNGGEWKEGEVLTDWLKYLYLSKFYENIWWCEHLAGASPVVFECWTCEGGARYLRLISFIVNLLLVIRYLRDTHTHTHTVKGCLPESAWWLCSVASPIRHCSDRNNTCLGDNMERLHSKSFVKLRLGSGDFPTTPIPATTLWDRNY